jgi:hypothetical protein
MPIRMSDLLKESVKKLTNRKLQLEQDDEVRRGPGRPAGAKNKPKEPDQLTPEEEKAKAAEEERQAKRDAVHNTFSPEVRSAIEAARKRREARQEAELAQAAAKLAADEEAARVQREKDKAAGKKGLKSVQKPKSPVVARPQDIDADEDGDDEDTDISDVPDPEDELPTNTGGSGTRKASTDFNPDDIESVDIDQALTRGTRPVADDERVRLGEQQLRLRHKIRNILNRGKRT